MAGGPVTVLFTDLVRSTELLQRVGDEQALRVLRAHQRLLRDTLVVHGGQEVKWTGDGLMTTFASSADAVRCAVAMQQRTRMRAAGERLAMRAGLHVGEVLRDERDWVGASVVVARRLCDRAAAGQILCSGLVVELLNGRRAFRFDDVGPLELKGFAAPVAAWEVRYDRDDPAAVLRHTPFTGRATELARLERRLEEARGGRGGVAMLVGEPGIGKTRTLEEFVETARGREAQILWGRCYEGEAARPYGPFAEALAEYACSAELETLKADLGSRGAPLARLVPPLKERLPDLPEPVPLQPDEERTRLIDAVTQFLLALAARTPTVLVLDDLHWADAGTVALLRHVARFAPRERLLVVGAYRDVEIGREHPLADVLGVLPRETTYDQVALAGLEPAAVQELLEAVADQEVAQGLVATITRETSGNPFFIRAVLLHLLEEGLLAPDGTSWRLASTPDRIGLPATVRQAIERRLVRISEAALRLLRVAAAFTGGIDFEVARRVAGLGERAALDALDAALAAQLLVPTGEGRAYDFTHALVRQTLYETLNPSRRARLHRRIAEAIVAECGEQTADHAAEIAAHYHRSKNLRGAERGAEYAIAAADRAGAAYAHDLVASLLRLALELLPPADERRARVLARLGLALVYSLAFRDALAVAREAGHAIAATEGTTAAADYLAQAVRAMNDAGYEPGAVALASQGLAFAGERRDATWVTLMEADLVRREAEDPEYVGIPLDSEERRECARVLLEGFADVSGADAVGLERLLRAQGTTVFLFSRIGTRAALVAAYVHGDYRRGLPVWRGLALDAERQGRIGLASSCWASVYRLHIALGQFAGAREARDRSLALAQRLTVPSYHSAAIVAGDDDWHAALDEGWKDPVENVGPGFGEGAVRAWFAASVAASAARRHARLGRIERALARLAPVVFAIERAPGWANNYVRLICDAAETLWLAMRTDWATVLERCLREKVIAPDLQYPMTDARLALARLCALQGRHDEAVEWFGKARAVLDEQGARPLRAIVDYDEALMYARRAAAGDPERVWPLLEAALREFRTLGMPGWIRRAEALLKSCAAGSARAEGHSQ